MCRNFLLAAAAAVLGLALAGCGFGVPGQAATPRPSANPVVVYHQLAQCVRTHGDPSFPDPTVDAQGNPHLPDNVPKPSDQIMQACSPILNQLPPSANPHPGADAAMMRRFAQCLRAHGITDWPDPNPDGSFNLPPSIGGNLKTSPRWPQINAAWSACRQYNNTGHISVSAS